MKFSEIFVGQRVFDRCFPEYGIGTVAERLKTRVKILFPNTTVQDRPLTYDKVAVHCLEKEKVRPPIPREDIEKAVKKVIGERKKKEKTPNV